MKGELRAQIIVGIGKHRLVDEFLPRILAVNKEGDAKPCIDEIIRRGGLIIWSGIILLIGLFAREIAAENIGKTAFLARKS
jgi:hypothetical protein